MSEQLRRYLLYALFRGSRPVSLPRVADQAVEWDTGEPAASVLEERLRIYMELYHDHLPCLIGDDVVTYHQEEDLVDLRPGADLFEPYVEQAFRDEITETAPSA